MYANRFKYRGNHRLTDASAESLMLSTILPLSEKLFSALRKILR